MTKINLPVKNKNLFPNIFIPPPLHYNFKINMKSKLTPICSVGMTSCNEEFTISLATLMHNGLMDNG